MQSEKNKRTADLLSPNQISPRDAKPTDFEILEPKDAAKLTVPFHGQCGDSESEYNRLLAETEKASPGKPKFDASR
jgi:predicted alpha/beta-fold hydrolase